MGEGTVNAAPEIQFSVFKRGGKLRSDFTEDEKIEINATPERARAFEALRAAADEADAAEAAVESETKELSVKVRVFNDLKGELLKSTPPRSFLDEWRVSVRGR